MGPGRKPGRPVFSQRGSFSDVDKVLFFATIHEIRRFVPRKKQYMGVVARGSRIVGLDVNVRRKLLYWTDELERYLIVF